jgi:16S rRNA (guanine966-N2)-methyltransferase
MGWLAARAIAVVETAADEAFLPPDGFTLIDERKYGAAKLVFLRREGGKP